MLATPSGPVVLDGGTAGGSSRFSANRCAQAALQYATLRGGGAMQRPVKESID